MERSLCALALVCTALAACSTSPPESGDASVFDASLDATQASDSATEAPDAPLPDGACLMVSPAVRCGDGVCDPGCEANAPYECPLDCPLPDGGAPCSGGPTKWTCNASGTALVQCFDGVLHVQLCGAPGSCHRVAGGYPDQCEACVPCTGWNSASPAHGQPYVYNCSTTNRDQRERCVDVRTGGDCIQGTSASADCCVVTDTCLGGACVVQPLGVDDRCP
ncbi:MAG: hypothetical protein K8H88_06385 [Sandaracinaceae bacterium]|nr:hypothetical protein [Sandaracinaceae bacterium]